MFKGSCGCGRVKFAVKKVQSPISFCHCWRCRKETGSSFNTTATALEADFVFASGEALLTYWESSPGVRRYRASCCGTPIFKRDDSVEGELRLRLGCLDDDPGIAETVHWMAGSKAPWLTLHDNLHKDESGPPFGQRDC